MGQPFLQDLPASPQYSYRADVMADGSVALVADTDAIRVVTSPSSAPVESISLTAEQFANLHAMVAAPDLKLVYSDGEFSPEAIGNVS